MTGEEFDDMVLFFDAMAQTKWLSSIHEQLKKLSGSWHEKNVLDVGCGTGRLLTRGTAEAATLTGVDLSSEMIRFATRLFSESVGGAEVHIEVGDATALPFAEQSFDVALSTCVLFLLPKPEEGIREISRVLRNGGTLALLNPGERMEAERARSYADAHGMKGFERESLLKWANVSTRRHRYDVTALNSLLAEEGLTPVSHETVLDGLGYITMATKQASPV
ncbi:class I SAM-dependent methyltransferase [Shouchella shacheensis]|uniref:class I SAM-dependent methyltransferase n=1 Tax=Shouchella shacheensis TaxID=1649580 RepID=UPI001FDF618B|nr:class I SAM-dependent methyltransferase [Shouchella shacheensis]